jgi:hypothetical protein
MAWKIELVEDYGNTGQIVVGVDSIPRIFYRGYDSGALLRYAYRDGSGWHKETIATGFNNINPAIAIREDHLAIAWWSSTDHAVHLGEKVIGGSWSYTTFAPTAYTGHTSITAWDCLGVQVVIDSSFVAHIVYSRRCGWPRTGSYPTPSQYVGHYSTMAYLSEGSETLFDTQTLTATSYYGSVDLSSTVDHCHKLGIDSSNVLHVTWLDYLSASDGSTLTYTICYANSSDWTPQSIATYSGYDNYFDPGQLVVTATDDVLLSYDDGAPTIFLYTVGTGGETIEAGSGYSSLGVDGAKIYSTYGSPNHLATKTGGVWSYGAAITDFANAPDMAVDPIKHRIHLLYYHTGDPYGTVYATQGNARAQWMFF